MNFVFEKITYIFDPLHHLWEHEKMHRKISIALVLFALTLLSIITAAYLEYRRLHSGDAVELMEE